MECGAEANAQIPLQKLNEKKCSREMQETLIKPGTMVGRSIIASTGQSLALTYTDFCQATANCV